MDNYIVINGKKAELTEEQLKALDIEIKKKRNNPFNGKLKYGDEYFIIDEQGVKTFFYVHIIDEDMLNNGNCFNDKDFANQVYLHELLNRKLLKYAWDNKAEDGDWKVKTNSRYYITFNTETKRFGIGMPDVCKSTNVVYFSSVDVARKAIEDVIKPFMENHKEFVW